MVSYFDTIDKMSALVYVMVWHSECATILREPTVTQFL